MQNVNANPFLNFPKNSGYDQGSNGNGNKIYPSGGTGSINYGNSSFQVASTYPANTMSNGGSTLQTSTTNNSMNMGQKSIPNYFPPSTNTTIRPSYPANGPMTNFNSSSNNPFSNTNPNTTPSTTIKVGGSSGFPGGTTWNSSSPSGYGSGGYGYYSNQKYVPVNPNCAGTNYGMPEVKVPDVKNGYAFDTINSKIGFLPNPDMSDVSYALFYKIPSMRDEDGKSNLKSHCITHLPEYLPFSVEELRYLNRLSKDPKVFDEANFPNYVRCTQESKNTITNFLNDVYVSACFTHGESEKFKYREWQANLTQRNNDTTFTAMKRRMNNNSTTPNKMNFSSTTNSNMSFFRPTNAFFPNNGNTVNTGTNFNSNQTPSQFNMSNSSNNQNLISTHNPFAGGSNTNSSINNQFDVKSNPTYQTTQNPNNPFFNGNSNNPNVMFNSQQGGITTNQSGTFTNTFNMNNLLKSPSHQNVMPGTISQVPPFNSTNNPFSQTGSTNTGVNATQTGMNFNFHGTNTQGNSYSSTTSTYLGNFQAPVGNVNSNSMYKSDLDTSYPIGTSYMRLDGNSIKDANTILNSTYKSLTSHEDIVAFINDGKRENISEKLDYKYGTKNESLKKYLADFSAIKPKSHEVNINEYLQRQVLIPEELRLYMKKEKDTKKVEKNINIMNYMPLSNRSSNTDRNCKSTRDPLKQISNASSIENAASKTNPTSENKNKLEVMKSNYQVMNNSKDNPFLKCVIKKANTNTNTQEVDKADIVSSTSTQNKVYSQILSDETSSPDVKYQVTVEFDAIGAKQSYKSSNKLSIARLKGKLIPFLQSLKEFEEIDIKPNDITFIINGFNEVQENTVYDLDEIASEVIESGINIGSSGMSTDKVVNCGTVIREVKIKGLFSTTNRITERMKICNSQKNPNKCSKFTFNDQQMMPRLTKDYRTNPSYDQLRGMNERELSSIKNFLIESDYGMMLYNNTIDLSYVNLDSVVLECQHFHIEQLDKRSFTKLNRPAIVKLYGITNENEKCEKDYMNFLSQLKSFCKQLKCDFIEYDNNTGELSMHYFPIYK